MKFLGVIGFLVAGLALSARVRLQMNSETTATCPSNKKYMIGKASYCKPPGISLLENIGGFPASELNCIEKFCTEETETNKDPKPCCETLKALQGDEFGVGSPLYLTKSKETKDALKAGLGLEGPQPTAHSDLSDGRMPWEKDAAKIVEKAPVAQAVLDEDLGPTEYCWCATIHNGFGQYPKSDKMMIGPKGYCTKDDPCNTCSRRHKTGGHNAIYDCCVAGDDGKKTSECGGAVMPTFTAEDTCLCGGTSVVMSQIFETNPECRPPKSNCHKCRHDCA
jgi:hypothetical protein